ncbi:MAG: zeta toxin family protein [Acidobacteriia bacterium]|nr:zeta toxin family protein [Terriglobia bacterium]
MLNEITHLAQHRADFGFETTLSGHGHMSLIRRLKDQGYQAHIFFLWVPVVDIALSRVRDRVLEGGHDVPEIDVRRRFERSIRNFFDHYRPLADSWILFDNSDRPPAITAFAKQGGLRIIEPAKYSVLVNRYGKHD